MSVSARWLVPLVALSLAIGAGTMLGWRYDRLEDGKSAVVDEAVRAGVHDTTLPGYGNEGHVFGDDQTQSERDAVIEYLRTL